MKLETILDYIYPPRCPFCDEISPQGICDSCRAQLHFIREDYCMKCGKPLTDSGQEYCPDCRRRRHTFDLSRSLLSYQGTVKQSLYRFKYANKREYATVYARELARAYFRWINDCRITRIVPVPLHRTRKRKRGYNQAEILARRLGRLLDIPVDTHLLYRRKPTGVQKLLDPSQRRRNLRGAFYACPSQPLCELDHILLIDDIYTTGSTADEAARALKMCGPCHVYVLTVAAGG